jgi:hypothetical protein
MTSTAKEEGFEKLLQLILSLCESANLLMDEQNDIEPREVHMKKFRQSSAYEILNDSELVKEKVV